MTECNKDFEWLNTRVPTKLSRHSKLNHQVQELHDTIWLCACHGKQQSGTQDVALSGEMHRLSSISAILSSVSAVLL